ncbi:MAG: hypothetical protein WAK17_09675 [Candidatus Nitrosopolaris sp.]|jgi:hypothetical protein
MNAQSVRINGLSGLTARKVQSLRGAFSKPIEQKPQRQIVAGEAVVIVNINFQ